ncbi:MAG: UDP-N-acetylglucosamine 1-carboxyvinyltransferase [Bacilli bacterium]|nr:UDP-N-acetylglucosamine 1-carboxyvinyltransferase [Mycoplasmatota bacterium]MDD6941769.1 UDP-N-acetylglucosamine 1-carboxyvinyltransferase [bacterium]MDY2696938.1 UDP-N-acetylglucosamine 1-carboxyvinyltransferase [Bacilli bacterium]MDY5992858.1 UDP-N-acetylglucosamine 1-carboxyvinyltransferase [Bacilli bacterium]MEE0014291.1 UDP-N-acetylglucosamine 1-carboxyvinyltransferase [Bacilli bacterium]
MKVIEIDGGHKLTGSIRVSGAKNATVALIPAAILTDEEVTICNVPEITDTNDLCAILNTLKVDIKRASESIIINPSKMENTEITEEFSKKLRASYYFMGALLGKYGKAVMYFPGGCSIGARPIDLHLKGFEALGAKVTVDKNKYTVEATELKGANIYLDIASVGATINIMLAAVKAKGKTIIDNAAKEPEIVNVATFLNNMGARITGAGTSTIKIEGVDYLHQCFHEVIPDRIEAGTYIIIGALSGAPLKVDNIIPEHIDSLISKLEEIGVNLELGSDYVIINSKDSYKSTNIKTAVYPGFPTDLQQPFTVLLTQSSGKSKVTETIWENRFMHIPYLNDLGADITVNNQTATILGPTKLKGCQVVATDLRAGAAMIAAGLKADGRTTITNAEHILRGYEDIVEKLSEVGAKIRIKEI